MTVDLFGWLWDLRRELKGGGDTTTGDLLDRLSAAGQNDATAEVEAVVPALIATARARRLPWLELYVRHWELQHRIFGRHEGGIVIAKAVEAFELAHRPEARGCPQAVCITQDLTAAYGQADGPGYAEERMAASAETLERIGPDWPCFDCLSNERWGALLDADRPADCLAAVDAAEAALRGAGQPVSSGSPSHRAGALLRMGDPAAAAAAVSADARARYSVHHPISPRVLDLVEALAWARSGRCGEAADRFSAGVDPLQHPRATGAWRDLARELVSLGVVDPEPVRVTLRALAHLHRDRAAHRVAFNLFLDVARLSASSGHLVEAGAARNRAAGLVAHLARPLDAPELLAAVDATLAAAAGSGSPPAPDGLDALEAACRDAPDDLQPVLTLAVSLDHGGWAEEALALLEEQITAHPEDEAPVGLSIDLLLDRGRVAEAEALALRSSASHPCLSLLGLAQVAFVRGRWTEVTELAAQIVTLEPTATRTRRLWAGAERELGDMVAAARLLEELLDLDDSEEGRVHDGDRWQAVVCGSASGRWDLVRRAGRELGMELSGDGGPVVEDWEDVLVTFLDDDGREVVEVASRTGPATATVRSVAWPGPVRTGDQIVFDPRPLDPVPEDEGEWAKRLLRFAHVATLSHGGLRSWPLLGAWPGHDQWVALRDELSEAGGAAWLLEAPRSWVHAELGEVERLYAHIAAPLDVPSSELSARLARLTEGWTAAAWPELATDAGEDATAHDERLTGW